MGKVLRSIKTWLRRVSAVFTIALLLVLAFAPSINADTEKNIPHLIANSTDNKLVKLIVTEHKPDGTKETKIVKLPRSQVEEMRERLKTAKDLDERLLVYKDYELIPQDITTEKLRAEMEERAQRLGLTSDKLEKMTSTRTGFSNDNGRVSVLNLLCLAVGGMSFLLPLFFGLSFLTARINSLISFLWQLFDLRAIPLYIPSFDLACISFALVGFFRTESGLLPESDIGFSRMFLLLIGFVGFSIGQLPILFPYVEFIGFAAIAFASGEEWVT